MKEARLIVPEFDKRVNHLTRLHHLTAAYLTQNFGGYTRFYATGGWVDRSGAIIKEPVVIFDVAMEDTTHNEALMRGWAMFIAREADQSAVYLRHASGKVEFVRANTKAAAA